MALDTAVFLSNVEQVETPIWSPLQRPFFDNSIASDQYIEFEDITDPNTLQNKTQITISLTDLATWFYPAASYIQFSYHILQATGVFEGDPFPPGALIAVENSSMSAFQKIELKIDNRTISTLEEPSTIMTWVSLLKWSQGFEDTNGLLMGHAHDEFRVSDTDPGSVGADAGNIGWTKRQQLTDNGKRFDSMTPLSELFPYFAEMGVIRGARIQIIFTLEPNDTKVLFRDNLEEDGKLVIDKLSIWYNALSPSSEVSIRLENELVSASKKLQIWTDLRHQRSTPFLPGTSQANYTFTINTGTPMFIIVAFFFEPDSQELNSKTWNDDFQISQLQVTMNSKLFPQEQLEMNFNGGDTDSSGRAYQFYLNGRDSFLDIDYGSILSHNTWKSTYRFFYIPLIQSISSSNRKMDFHIKVNARLSPVSIFPFNIDILTGNREMAMLQLIASKMNVVKL